MSDLDEIEGANTRFYQAFETLDLAQMDRVWAHGEHVKCVHPGWPILVGWDAVRSSWETIFENTAEMRFTLSDVRATASGDLAWVTCTENIFSEVRGRLAITTVLATNLFERGPGGWRLIHHHASHVLSATRDETPPDPPTGPPPAKPRDAKEPSRRCARSRDNPKPVAPPPLIRARGRSHTSRRRSGRRRSRGASPGAGPDARWRSPTRRRECAASARAPHAAL